MFRVKKKDNNLFNHAILNIKLFPVGNGKFSLSFENSENINEFNVILAKEYDLFPPYEIVSDIMTVSLFNENQPSPQVLDSIQQNLYAKIDQFRVQNPNKDQTLLLTPVSFGLNLFKETVFESHDSDELQMNSSHPSISL